MSFTLVVGGTTSSVFGSSEETKETKEVRHRVWSKKLFRTPNMETLYIELRPVMKSRDNGDSIRLGDSRDRTR